MANLPTLPNHAAAEIERARKKIITNRNEHFPVLFEREDDIFQLAEKFSKRNFPPREPNPATLKDELEKYTGALFDAEARTIYKYAESLEILRLWLSSVAQRIQNEVSSVTQNRAKLHDEHCPFHERQAAIIGALNGRSEFWVLSAEHDNQSAISKLRESRLQIEGQSADLAKALLEPIREEASPRYVRGRADSSFPTVRVKRQLSGLNLSAMKNLLNELIGHDVILQDAAKINGTYEVPVNHWSAIKKTVDEICDLIGYDANLAFYGQVPAIRSQILPVISKLQREVDALDSENSSLPVVPPDNTRASEPVTNGFPTRASWLKERLRERGWDHNDPYHHGGPDRKSVQKILAGGQVRPDTLRKLLHSLNQQKVDGQTVPASNIPTT